jgi:hypothetical protein
MNIRAILVLGLLIASCGSSVRHETTPTPPGAKQELRVVIPEEIEKDSYIRSIDSFAQENGLSKLRQTILPTNDLEIRVQVGFGLYGVDALLLKRAAAEWQAAHYRGMICPSGNRGKVTLAAPKSGWDAAWQRLRDAGILSLSGIKDSGIKDGTSYIVETNLNHTYRVYAFGNPDHLKDREGKQMVAIGDVIADEFGLETFKVNYVCK